MRRLLLAGAILGAAAAASISAQDSRGGQDGRFEGRRPFSWLAQSMDTDRDGTISSAEIQSAPAMLARLDADRDGRLTLDETRPPRPDGRGGGPPPPGDGMRGERPPATGGTSAPNGAASASPDDLADTLMAFDANGDGKLARTEVPERFRGLFDRADANKNEALTRDELKQSATASVQDAARGGRDGEGRSGRGRPDPLLRALDTDGDGVLSSAEIASASTSVLVLDANRDGALASDELRAAFDRPGGLDGDRR